jgi:hypothetical protein
MSTQTLVLYGNRLYDQVTYSTNQDSQTLTANLSDSVPLSDSRLFDLAHGLADTLILSDIAVTRSSIKALLDTLILTDSHTFIDARMLADFLILSDLIVRIATKTTSDFIILNEWLSITLIKADIWTLASPEPDLETVFAPPLYGKVLYSKTLYGGASFTDWTTPGDSDENFTNLDGEGNVP